MSPTLFCVYMDMGAATITALLSGLGGEITSGINQALVNGNAGREDSNFRGRPDYSKRHRPVTAAQILKSQQAAFDHVVENIADPGSRMITAFVQSAEEKLTSEHCKKCGQVSGVSVVYSAVERTRSTRATLRLREQSSLL